MHIVFIGFVWPEPCSSAAGQNIISYISACRKANFDVSFLCAAEQNQYSANLANYGVTSYVTKLNCISFNSQIMQLQPDIVIFDRFLTFEQFAWRVTEHCPNALLVIDAEDLHFLRKARQLLVKSLSNNNKTNIEHFTDVFSENGELLNPELLYNDLSFREIACILRADLTIVLSSFEERLLTGLFNIQSNQVAHLPFILSNSAIKINPESFEAKRDFIFIGNFRHAPNMHAAELLAQKLWPTIRKRLISRLGSAGKHIKCNVYGAYMTPQAKQLHNPNINFFMHGHADDQFEVINNARVMLAPITFGAGVKGKLLDAMRMNTPCITTPVGAEGITALPFAGKVVDKQEAFIEAAVDSYCDDDLYQQYVANGKKVLKSDYKTERNSDLFIETLKHAKLQQSKNRQTNFLQKMLSQQQFQATKYMSQWIEAKNSLLNAKI